MEKKLYRDEYHKKIAGVCAGLADYFNVDVTLIRVLFVLTLVLKGGGVLVYIVLWIVLPVKNYLYNNPTVDYKVPPSPFGSTPPFDMPAQNPGEPFMVPPPVRHRSSGTIIAGAILIVLGSFFLLDEFDIIPDWDFERLWPLILIAIGAVFMVTHSKKQPWEKEGWNAATPLTPDADMKDETINNDNPSTPTL